mmetsp:Transcript_5288/g.16161  ORF Transcript_5288/g.16161 Transcript_5288/m.16161 type:complete len:846 (-) Transcript_5288:17-2554(-)
MYSSVPLSPPSTSVWSPQGSLESTFAPTSSSSLTVLDTLPLCFTALAKPPSEVVPDLRAYGLRSNHPWKNAIIEALSVRNDHEGATLMPLFSALATLRKAATEERVRVADLERRLRQTDGEGALSSSSDHSLLDSFRGASDEAADSETLRALRRQTLDLERRLTRQQSRYADMAETLVSHLKRRDVAESRARQAIDDAKRLREERTQLHAAVQELRAETETQQQVIGLMREELGHARQRIIELEREGSGLVPKMLALESRLLELQAELRAYERREHEHQLRSEKLQKQLAASTDRYHATYQERIQLFTENQRLREKLHETEEQLALAAATNDFVVVASPSASRSPSFPSLSGSSSSSSSSVGSHSSASYSSSTSSSSSSFSATPSSSTKSSSPLPISTSVKYSPVSSPKARSSSFSWRSAATAARSPPSEDVDTDTPTGGQTPPPFADRVSRFFETIFSAQPPKTNVPQPIQQIHARPPSTADFSLSATGSASGSRSTSAPMISMAAQLAALSDSGVLAAKPYPKTMKSTISSAHGDAISSIIFSPSGLSIVTGSQDRTVRVWSKEGGSQNKTYCGATGGIRSADVSVDGKLVVASGHDHRVLVWDAKSEKLLTTMTGHTNTVDAVRFFPQGSRIVTGGWDRKLKLWDTNLESRQPCLQTLLCSGRVTDILPDYSGMLCVGHYDGSLRIYSSHSASSKPLYEIPLHSQPISSVRANVNDSLLITLSRDSRIRVVEKRMWKPLLSIRDDNFTSSTETNVACFSANGKHVLAGGSTGEVFVWNAKNGKLQERLSCPSASESSSSSSSSTSSPALSTKKTSAKSICGMALNGDLMVTVHKDCSLSFWG